MGIDWNDVHDCWIWTSQILVSCDSKVGVVRNFTNGTKKNRVPRRVIWLWERILFYLYQRLRLQWVANEVGTLPIGRWSTTRHSTQWTRSCYSSLVNYLKNPLFPGQCKKKKHFANRKWVTIMYCNGGDKWKLKEKIKKYYNMPGRPVSPLILAAHVLQAFCAPLGSAALKASRKRKKKKNDNKSPNLAPSFRVQREEEAVRFDRSHQ